MSDATTLSRAAAPAVKRKVLLVEDHAVVREGLAQLINEEPDLVVCGQAEDIPAALREVEAADPDVVIVDLLLGESDGLELIRQLRKHRPELPTLALSMYKESLYAERALRAGARGYVTKVAPTEIVLLALRRVLSGSIYVSDRVANQLLSKLAGGADAAQNTDPAEAMARLSDREFEVFKLMGRGLGPTDVATRLGVSVKTVETYQHHLKRKLGVGSARELLQLATAHALREGAQPPGTA